MPVDPFSAESGRVLFEAATKQRFEEIGHPALADFGRDSFGMYLSARIGYMWTGFMTGWDGHALTLKRELEATDAR